MKKPSKPSKASIIKQLKVLWPLIIYGQHGRICGWTDPNKNHNGYIQPHHIVPVGRAKHLQFDPVNGFPLCQGCHYYVTSVGGGMVDFTMWFSRHYPVVWKYLQAHRYDNVQIKKWLLEEWLENLQKIKGATK